MGTSSVVLPSETIELILSKCPVESVVRFQAVSKSWQSIISGPRFSRFYRIQRSQLREDHNKFFLWRVPRGQQLDYSLYLIRLEDEKFRTKSDTLLGYPSSGKFFTPLSSCDGLILLHVDGKDYMLWNPLIGKHIIIPAINQKSHPKAFRNWINPYPLPRKCHLYHDSITDDYKIVFLYKVQCYTVYSCKNGSWGEMKYFPCDWDLEQIECEAGIDGCFYGMGFGNTEIICFDARDGKLHKFPQPEGVECLFGVQLKAMSGRLCLYGFSDYSVKKLHLWVMEENGRFEKSWKKLISMEKEEPCIRDMMPVHLTNKDDVVLWATVKTENGVYKDFIYNPRTKRSFKEIDFTWDVRHQFFSYSENLDMPSSNIC